MTDADATARTHALELHDQRLDAIERQLDEHDDEVEKTKDHRSRVDLVLKVVGACALVVIGGALVTWSSVQTTAVQVQALAARVAQVEAARADDARDLQGLRDVVSEVRADTRVMRTQLELTVRALNADGASR